MNGRYTIEGGKLATLNMKMKGRMERTTINDQKLAGDVEVELAQIGERKETYAEISFQFPSSSPTLQLYVDQSGKQEIHLNGQPITEAEMKKLFGENFEFSAK